MGEMAFRALRFKGAPKKYFEEKIQAFCGDFSAAGKIAVA
jgi:hypothetical protein